MKIDSIYNFSNHNSYFVKFVFQEVRNIRDAQTHRRLLSRRSPEVTPVISRATEDSQNVVNTSISGRTERRENVHERNWGRQSHPSGDDVEAGENETSCTVCMSNKPQILSTECGHLCVCIRCSKHIFENSKKCPVCRGSWSSLVKVYM